MAMEEKYKEQKALQEKIGTCQLCEDMLKKNGMKNTDEDCKKCMDSAMSGMPNELD